MKNDIILRKREQLLFESKEAFEICMFDNSFESVLFFLSALPGL